LTNHYIISFQYTVLVTVVILSAVIPTLIAQTFFRPQATSAALKQEAVEAALIFEEEETAGAIE
jgi:hypothetical protein